MKVHFVCSTGKIKEFKDNYLLICKLIKELDHEIVNDWIDRAVERMKGKFYRTDREKTYRSILNAIEKADVLVVEGTVQSISVGHQVALAMQKEKPILFLVYEPMMPEKPFPHLFIEQGKSSLVMHATYTIDNIKDVMSKFFELYKGGGKFRFNLLLERDVRDYLNWASKYYQKTKSQIIRKLVLQEADKDKEYKSYHEILLKGKNN